MICIRHENKSNLPTAAVVNNTVEVLKRDIFSGLLAVIVQLRLPGMKAGEAGGYPLHFSI